MITAYVPGSIENGRDQNCIKSCIFICILYLHDSHFSQMFFFNYINIIFRLCNKFLT